MKDLKEGLVEVGIYMKQTMGFPIEAYVLKVNQMNRAQQLAFYFTFCKNYNIAYEKNTR